MFLIIKVEFEYPVFYVLEKFCQGNKELYETIRLRQHFCQKEQSTKFDPWYFQKYFLQRFCSARNFFKLLKMFMRKFVGEHFRMFCWNFLKCSWTYKKFQNVPLELFKMFLNIQKVPEHICKHFKSKCRVKKYLRTNSEIFWKKFWELLKMFMRKFVGKYFRMFHSNFLKRSWTFKKFPKEFVNIMKYLQSQNVPLEFFKKFLNIQKVPEQVCTHFKKYLRTICNVLDSC